ncbi:unnamed protein product [Phytophthora fragariaefolia]|uniref:Unnamed protein product n=1 Tax=Phytophthora fragariaefolia TaxID=1490495 RepID=A0A9W7CGC5_9STRA|nr:unnamed protein product [Phytophthora fragariaefolia]
MPVKFTRRTLKPNELNYNMVEKEILALLRALSDGFTMLIGRRRGHLEVAKVGDRPGRLRVAPDLTVNEADSKGLLLGCSLLEELGVTRLIICGDSNLVIHQMRGEMDCKSPGLKLLRQQARDEL